MPTRKRPSSARPNPSVVVGKAEPKRRLTPAQSAAAARLRNLGHETFVDGRGILRVAGSNKVVRLARTRAAAPRAAKARARTARR